MASPWASRRFRRLERGPLAPSTDEEPRAELPAPAFRRQLERDGELVLDASDTPRTTFCRGCDAEISRSLARCPVCDAALGGAGQEEHDAARHEARVAASQSPEHPGEPALGGSSTLDAPAVERALREILERADERDAPGFGAVLTSGVLLAGIFAMVSMPVRLMFAAAAGSPMAWGRFLELGLVVLISFALYRHYGRQLRSL